MNTVKKERIDNLFKTNPEVAKEFANIEGVEELAAMLARHGIELSNEDLDDILKEADTVPLPDAGELGEDDLENVSGGIFTAALIGMAAFGGLLTGIRLRREIDRKMHGDPYYTYPKGFCGV